MSDGDYSSQRWLFTTVQASALTWWDYLGARAAGDTVLRSTSSGSDTQHANVAAMEESKRLAWATSQALTGALTQAEPAGARVVSVEPDSPAAHAGLSAGGVITAVDTTKVSTAQEAADALNPDVAHTVDVLDVFGTRTEATLQPSLPPGPFGVVLDDATSAPPSPFEIDTAAVSGPSAGLMFALAILDATTPGDLSGQRRVAGSGELDTQAGVHPVGGIGYKAEAAQLVGADLFFAPASEAAVAQRAAPHLEVIAVNTLGEALRWLCTNGGHSSACP